MAKKVDTRTIVSALFKYGSEKVLDAVRLSPEANTALGKLYDAVARGSSSELTTTVTVPPSTRPTKRSARNAKEGAIWMEIVAELSRGVFFRKPVGAAPSDIDGRIEFFARQLKNATLEAGRAWAELTEVVERMCLDFLKENGCQLAVSTVMRAVESEETNFVGKKMLIMMWEPYATTVGFTLKKIVDMFPVGKLLRDYPRLQGYSCPERLSGHVEYIRDMLKFDADIAAEFMRPVSIEEDLRVDGEKAKKAQQFAQKEKSARKKRAREEDAAASEDAVASEDVVEKDAASEDDVEEDTAEEDDVEEDAAEEDVAADGSKAPSPSVDELVEAAEKMELQ